MDVIVCVTGGYLPLYDDAEHLSLYSGIDIETIVCPQYIKIAGESSFKPIVSMAMGIENSRCLSVKNVILPSTLKYIDNETLVGMSELESLEIPSSVESVEWDGLGGYNPSLTNMVIHSQHVLKADHSDLSTYFPSLANVELDCNIPSYSINWCGYLETIKIGSNCSTVARNAFDGCDNLKCLIRYNIYKAKPL